VNSVTEAARAKGKPSPRPTFWQEPAIKRILFWTRPLPSATKARLSLHKSRKASYSSVMSPLLERITVDPQVCGGRPCIKGTRIWVSLLLGLMAGGTSEAEILAEYPQLSQPDVLAALAYGAETARGHVVAVPPGRAA
jgi:uncharacterized protein (DUF433 family)